MQYRRTHARTSPLHGTPDARGIGTKETFLQHAGFRAGKNGMGRRHKDYFQQLTQISTD
jgi:hypothetical protein